MSNSVFPATLSCWNNLEWLHSVDQYQSLQAGEISRPLTSPCLRRLRSHTPTLPRWTAPSPPRVKVGSREGREGAWGRAVQAAGAQTAANKYKHLIIEISCASLLMSLGKHRTKRGLVYDHSGDD